MSIRVGLVGAGKIARTAHLPAWRSVEGGEVVVIADRDGTLAAEVAHAWQIPRWTDDPFALVDDDEIDAIDICTPASTHAALATSFLAAGKHALVEKPPALSITELRSIASAAEATNGIAMVAENWVFAPAFIAGQAAISDGSIGEPIALQTVHESPFWVDPLKGPRPDADGLGYFFAAGSHSVHGARTLVGDIAEVAAFATLADASRFPPCDHELVLAGRAKSGALISMSVIGRSMHQGPRRLWFKVFGETGVVEFDVWSGWTEITCAGSRRRLDHGDQLHGFEAEVAHFVECVRTGKRPLTAVADYTMTLVTILAGYQSAIEHRVVLSSEIAGASSAEVT